MHGYAIICAGDNSNREWHPDDKTALYRAAELSETYPVVLVHYAARRHSTITDGTGPLVRYVDGRLDLSIL
jgi:hypothetical protein